MEFKLEREMTPIVERWLRDQDMWVKREFLVPWGPCDLVGCALDPVRVQQRLAFRQRLPIGPAVRVSLLEAIPDSEHSAGITLVDLACEMRDQMSLGQLREHIEILMRRKFVVSTSAGRIAKLNGWCPMQSRLVAVELKLNRIPDVLSQASCNQGFASESIAAIPLTVARRVLARSLADEFRAKGIGILGVTREECQLLLPPRLSDRVSPVLEVHCVERFWADLRRSKSA